MFPVIKANEINFEDYVINRMPTIRLLRLSAVIRLGLRHPGKKMMMIAFIP